MPDSRNEEYNKYPRLSQEELSTLIAGHGVWLESRGRRGKRGEFERLDLSGAQLENVNLSSTRITQVNLSGANLRGANLRSVCLDQVDLSLSELAGASFRNASVVEVNLTGATGLRVSQFAGTDITGTELPSEVSGISSLDYVQKATDQAQTLFISLILLCVYCWLTIASTKDVDLLTNTPSSSLPIIQTQIHIVGFFLVAPILLVFFSLYFHIALQRLWEAISRLPAVFTDGNSLDSKLVHWLFSAIIRSNVVLLADHRIPFSRIQALLSHLALWWLAPLTIFLIWMRYIPRHDSFITIFHAFLCLVSVVSSIIFERLVRQTLRGDTWSPRRLRDLFYEAQTARVAALIVLLALIVVAISYGGLNGVCPGNVTNPNDVAGTKRMAETLTILDEINSARKGGKAVVPGLVRLKTELRIWVPLAMERLDFSSCLRVQSADISEKGSGWTGKDVELVKGANLQGRQLQFARAGKAFLVKANLNNADMRGIDLQWANLQRAVLTNTRLEYANLEHADLTGADLRGAHLEGVRLQKAQLRNANLSAAHIQGAELTSADMIEAGMESAHLEQLTLKGFPSVRSNLSHVNLQGAKLTNALLNGATMVGANLTDAVLAGAFLQGADLSDAHLENAKLTDAKLQGAQLIGTRLQHASLVGARLQGADLTNAHLNGAKLQWANFSGARLEGAHFDGAEDIQKADFRGAKITSETTPFNVLQQLLRR